MNLSLVLMKFCLNSGQFLFKISAITPQNSFEFDQNNQIREISQTQQLIKLVKLSSFTW